MALFDDDGGVIVRPTILNCVEHERLNAARAALRCFRDCTIADIAAWRSRDAQGQPLQEGAQAATVLVDRKIYPARTHLADFYCFLWACYFKENPADLTLAARYDAFLDQSPGQRRHVARRTDTYPPEGLSRLSDAAAIAALVGGRLLPPPFDELLTRIEPTPAPNTIYTLGYTGSTPAIVQSYVKRLGAVLVDVRKSANSRVPHWRGAALAAQLGDRYLYLPDFGNDNYLGDGPIQLHNPAIVVEDARQGVALRSNACISEVTRAIMSRIGMAHGYKDVNSDLQPRLGGATPCTCAAPNTADHPAVRLRGSPDLPPQRGRALPGDVAERPDPAPSRARVVANSRRSTGTGAWRMSCETSYGRFLAAACTPNSPLTQHLGGGDPLVTRRVLEEVFSIAQERAARALTQRQPPDPRLRKPIHLLQQRGAGAAAREDCVRLFREIAAAGITPPAHGDLIDGETFALPKPAAIHAYAEVQRALDAAERGEQTLLVNEVIAARAARAESAARSEAGKRAKVRAPTEEEYLRAWADENAWLLANDRPLVRIVADDLGPRLIFATGFGGDQEWAIYSVALGRKGRGGSAKPRGATLDGYTSAEGPLPDRPRRWGGDDDHGQWQRMASHLDHAMTKGAGSLRAAEIRTLTPHIEALARASDDLRASNEALLPIIRPLIDRDQATCKRLLETGVEGLIRFTIAEAMIDHQNRNNPGADGAWDDDLDRQIAPLIRASFDAADRQAAADAALWEAMRPLAERSLDDIEALNRLVTITCGARFKLVQLKIDQAKPGGGPS